MKDDVLIQKAQEAAEQDLLALDEKRDKVADRLVKYALGKGLRVFLDKNGQPHAIFPEKPIVAFPIKGPAMRRWLAGIYWAEYEKGFSGENFLQVAASLEGKAFYEGDVRTVYNRIANDDGVIYYDLGDDKRAVEVTPDGWQITSEVPVLFYRFRHQISQVDPSTGGKLSDVLKFINLKSESEQLLFLTYLVAAFVPDIPRVVLINTGDHGAAKSTALRVARSLIDPSISDLLQPARDVEELILNANHHYCLYLDNISSLPGWLSDLLCRLCTGVGFSKRQLYSDNEDIIFQQKVAVGITGINLVAEKPDLLDRSLILRFEQISESERSDEKEFWSRFDQEKARILGALLTTLSQALKTLPNIALPRKPRMADYAKYAAAAALSLGYSTEQFLSAFSENTNRQNQAAIESSVTAQVILEFVKDKDSWSGSSSQLHATLLELATAANLKVGGEGGFPKSSNWLWKKIQTVKTNLFSLGIKVSHDENNIGSLIIIEKVSKNPQNTATTVTIATSPTDSGDSTFPNRKNTATYVQPRLNTSSEANAQTMATVAAELPKLESATSRTMESATTEREIKESFLDEVEEGLLEVRRVKSGSD